MEMPAKAARIYRAFDQFMLQAGRGASRSAHTRLVAEAGKAARAFAAGAGEAAALAEVLDSTWIAYLGAVWVETVTRAGVLTAESLGAAAVDAGVFDRAARLYLQRNTAGRRGGGIADTSRNSIAKSIEYGQVTRETPAEIARRIIADAENAAEWRSATIGLTESHAAGNYGAWKGAAQTLRGWEKIWAAPRAAGVTCDQHKSTQGQRRPLVEAFDVRNDYEPETEATDVMNYPGDGEYGARASNVINCRCAMEFRRAML